jgi:hypothetical protein
MRVCFVVCSVGLWQFAICSDQSKNFAVRDAVGLRRLCEVQEEEISRKG